MGWTESGQAWGARATDWAYLLEPYARNANDALCDRAGVSPGTRLLDIACGTGEPRRSSPSGPT
jgi:cyclopropane fatty-acyl-phospholipid synthase-like methyltransferase